MRGRKSIPSKIIQLRGGTAHTHKKPRDQEPQPPEKMPKCPKHLDKGARKEWRRVGKTLMSIGIMSDLERAHLAGYCQSWSEWVVATIAVQEIGTVYKKADGTPGLNPHIRLAREAYERWLKAAAILGIGTSNRVGLKVDKPRSASKAEKFLARKGGVK